MAAIASGHRLARSVWEEGVRHAARRHEQLLGLLVPVGRACYRGATSRARLGTWSRSPRTFLPMTPRRLPAAIVVATLAPFAPPGCGSDGSNGFTGPVGGQGPEGGITLSGREAGASGGLGA